MRREMLEASLTRNVGLEKFERALQVEVRQDRFGNRLEIGGVTEPLVSNTEPEATN